MFCFYLVWYVFWCFQYCLAFWHDLDRSEREVWLAGTFAGPTTTATHVIDVYLKKQCVAWRYRRILLEWPNDDIGISGVCGYAKTNDDIYFFICWVPCSYVLSRLEFLCFAFSVLIQPFERFRPGARETICPESMECFLMQDLGACPTKCFGKSSFKKKTKCTKRVPATRGN